MVTKLVDGDQLTFLAVKNPTYHKLFMTMVPTYAFIDRATGYFNRAMDFKKDYAALVSYRWDMDNAIYSYLTNPDDDSFMMLRAMGIEAFDTANSEDEKQELIKYRDRVLNQIKNSPKSAFRDQYFGDDE